MTSRTTDNPDLKALAMALIGPDEDAHIFRDRAEVNHAAQNDDWDSWILDLNTDHWRKIALLVNAILDAS